MRKDSKELVDFVQRWNLSFFQKTTFSAPSKTILIDLFKTIQESESVWEHAYPKQFEIEAIWKKPGEPFPRSGYFSSYPKEIQTEIVHGMKTGYLYRFMVHGRKIEAIILHVGETPMKTAKPFTAAIQKVFQWLYVAGRYSNARCSRKMNIYMYWTGAKKSLPLYGDIIEEIHANTAFTTSCKEVTELNLFREEEWFKVFVHETFHNMGLDFSAYPQENVVRRILEIFPVKSDVNLFETYCETWAELVNICFLVFFSSREKGNMENMLKKTEKMLDVERMFSAFQCMKVLHFYGLEYSDLYVKTNAAHLARMKRYKESTNILSYYILKSLLLFYVDDFLCWCKEHNGEAHLNFGKRDVEENMIDYCEFIGQRYLREEYKGTLAKIEPWFHSKEAKKNSLVRKTMRMTVYE